MSVVAMSRVLPPARTGPCRRCDGEATRTFGADAFCSDCSDDLQAEIRLRILARDGVGVGVRHGRAQPECGPRMWMLCCVICAATWVDVHGAPCPWCAERLDELRAEQRGLLLNPPWLDSDRGDEGLSELDQAVWARTRGVDRGADSIAAWGIRLAVAVRSELITDAEARKVLTREEDR